MVFRFGKKVVIVMRLEGSDVKEIRASVDRIHKIVKEKTLGEMAKATDPGYSEIDELRKLIEKAKSAADGLKEFKEIDIEDEFFNTISELVLTARHAADSEDYKWRKANIEFVNETYKLAQYMYDLIKRVMEREITFIRDLKKDMGLIESAKKLRNC